MSDCTHPYIVEHTGRTTVVTYIRMDEDKYDKCNCSYEYIAYTVRRCLVCNQCIEEE